MEGYSAMSRNVTSGRRYQTDRTEGISDGVFAVALTLLILDVKPPDGNAGELAHDLAAIAPRMGTFILSFAIVAYYWLVHHLIFASIRQVKIALIWTNFLFLLTIVVLPFSTAILGRYPLAEIGLIIYGINLAACTSTLAAVWFVADRGKLTEQLHANQRRYVVRRFGFQSLVALIGVAFADIAPAVSLAIFVAFPIAYALTYRRTYY
jgi:uncharacterized membrane protein